VPRLSLLALACLIGGVALLAYGVSVGQGQVYLVFIVPVFTGSGPIPFAGLARMPLAALEGPASAPQTSAPAKRFGGVVFLGPFPIVFGSDVTMSKYMLVLAVAMTVLLLAFFFLVLVKP
jgi:uncharacterized protein (TIGR00304 family)